MRLSLSPAAFQKHLQTLSLLSTSPPPTLPSAPAPALGPVSAPAPAPALALPPSTHYICLAVIALLYFECIAATVVYAEVINLSLITIKGS